MTLADGLLLFLMIWALVFMVALAIPFPTQGESGDVVPGTPSSAPARVNLARRARFTTAVAAVLFLCTWAVIELDLTHGPMTGDVTVPATEPSGG
ncbi:DUF1467 family protein [Solirhodobacter olei]|jgi:predicted secreted protein|uniref:DUF1467 family protein n=1 Tax=Solirhodobacter olei TaxID=2493082 RepID=UPI000FD81640|nr:DUF1467 family protein [Solirhodobacter olei]